jgi:hypothetical protein
MSITDFKAFSDSISISSDEETKLGIQEDLHGHSIVASEVYDSRRMGALPTVRDAHGDSPRRIRQSAPSQRTTSSAPPLFNLLYQTSPPIPLVNSYSNDVFN